MRSKEDVISIIIRSYCLANDGDEATTDLLLAVGAEILGVSAEEMQKRLAWSDRESDVPNQEDGHEQDRFTKRLPDGQAIMDCQKCEADWTAKHGKPLEQCTALYCRNRCKDRLADYEDAETIVPISDKVCPKEVGPAKQLGRCVLLDWDTLNGQMLREGCEPELLACTEYDSGTHDMLTTVYDIGRDDPVVVHHHCEFADTEREENRDAQ